MSSRIGGSDRFVMYESEFSALQNSLGSHLASLSALSGAAFQGSVRTIERELDECEEIVGQMELELLNVSAATKTALAPRLRTHKSALEGHRRTLATVLSSARGRAGQRNELLGGDGRGNGTREEQNRDRLLQGTHQLYDGNRRLEESHRIAMETETLGAGILGDLRRQREQIVHTRDTLHETESNVDRAQRTLKGMARRMVTNRLISFAIMLVLSALIILILYAKLFR